MADPGEMPKEGDATKNNSEHDEPDSGRSTSTHSTSSPVLKRASTTPLFSSSTSATTSPRSSREVSPAKRQSLGIRSPARSRKNSTDRSPARGGLSGTGATIPSVPSAAAIQRALSAAGAHTSNPTQHDDRLEMPKTQRAAKPAVANTSKSTQRTPRLSSPPPAASSGLSKTTVNTSRKADQTQSAPTTPSIVVDRHSSGPGLADADSKDDSALHRTGVRTPTRGPSGSGAPLETVQEASLPSTPSPLATKTSDNTHGPERTQPIEENPMEDMLANEGKSKTESGNESAGSKSLGRKSGDEAKEGWKPTSTATSFKPPAIHSKKSYTQIPGKLKTASEGSTKNMTVETETVSSIPQVAVGGGTGERSMPGRSDTAGSLRLKESTETIRPKKDKKRVVRKTTSLNAGAGGYHSRYFLRQRISPGLHSPDFPAISSLESSRSSVFDSRAEDSLESPTDPLPSGRTSFSSTKPPGPPFRRWSFGLMSFRARTASSKADIFEAKVASAVGEADSSDSEETFVYESNPPEPHSVRTHKVHSRTPSTASTLSQADFYGTKNRQDSHHNVAKKKSMKFATNYGSIVHPDEIEGTIRGPSGGSRGGTPHHHHIGRFGRGGHASILDKESPFSNGSKTPHTAAAAQLQQFSNRHQRSPQSMRFSGNSRKAEEALSYDLEGEGADDEGAPLMGSIRSGRNRRRPLPGSVRQIYADEREKKHCGRISAFVSLGGVLALLIAAIVVILVLCTKPLFDVVVVDIRNVLASESEIMLDLHVQAINPNIIAITVSDLDLNVFAKSRHVRASSIVPRPRQRELPSPIPHPPGRHSSNAATISLSSSPLHTPNDLVDQLDGIDIDGVDEGTDPMPYPDDPSSDSQTMLLGRIFSFDSPLNFEPSPIHHRPLSSIGEVRLSRPGNKTEEGGSARWERVLQHDFELIVRGVVKYSLPISSKMRRESIGGKVVVHPTEEDSEGGKGGMRLSRPVPKKGGGSGSNVIIEPPPIRTETMLRLRRRGLKLEGKFAPQAGAREGG